MTQNTPKMHCFVPLCESTVDNVSTSEKPGITFHELPSEENLRSAWLRALGAQEHNLPDPAVVCSQHFLEDDFYKTNTCVRQIHSTAIPSTVQMCMICLDTDSKLFAMSKHKLEEAYEQLTGLSLCRGGNPKQALCVMCAQRLINFSRFRDLCLRVHSMMTDLLEQHELITVQHKEWMNYAIKHLQCNFTQTTLGADHCDLYIYHTDEEKQTAAEESVVGDAAVVVKKEDSSDSMSNANNLELLQEDDNVIDNSNNDCVSDDEYSDMSIKLETKLLDEAISEALQRQAAASCTAVAEDVNENAILECAFCFEDFVQVHAYNEHMSKHLQKAACDASQVCEPRAAGSRSCDSFVLEYKARSQERRLNDDPPPSADSADLALVALLSMRFATYDKNKKQATEEAGAIPKSEPILETNTDLLDDQSSQSYTKTCTDINTFTNCVVRLNDIYKKPKNPLLNKNLCVTTDTAAKLYSCEICNVKCSIKHNLLRHMKTHTGEKPYSCEICNHKCARKSHLLQHMKTHTGDKPYSCEICNYKCSQKHHLSRHMVTHSDDKPYSCQICNYKCALKHHLLQHMKTHTGDKPYSCEICNYKCSQKHHLSRHMKTHSDNKPYSCEICNYKSAHNSYLLQHMKTHTGVKPYSCEICNYKCALKQHLSQHMKTHAGVKPFPCQICNHKFARKGDLLQHMRIHTGEKPYSCEICNYKSARKSHLLQHMRIHTGEKPYTLQ